MRREQVFIMKSLGIAALACSLAASSVQAESYTEALISLHKTLVEVDSTTKSEAPGTEALKTYLETKFTVELQAVEGDRKNVYAYPGNSRNSRVLLTSHIDTVPPYIPYSRNGEEIRGRGTADAKGSVAAQIIAVEELLESGDIKDGDVSLLFVVGEESGGQGMQTANNLNVTWEAVIFGEPTENKLVRAHKGVLGLNVTASGIAGHSGYPEQGRNAIDLLVRSLGAIIDVDLPSSEQFGNTTLNVGVIEGGIASNVIPENATARTSIRVAVEDVDSVKSIISQAAYAATPEHVSLSFNAGAKPVSLDYDIDGFNTTVVNYFTDVPNLKGTHKRYLYGPGTILVAHSNDEHITVSDLETAVEGYKTLILESLKK
ncbi:C6 zinc finger domain-containing protein [Colletotrichum truncatum]|uniref:C6 zinc finger domain-containing protein n=1 Tax=Colletotrichum truncatum TaxID=5467 RepID=A0ACC3Z781_COLTU|nr:C6 zinc finger domain-containing protein [Colletotrichum truncatum]KAF6785276.1 C6 zinc finger domain-containing protein [Colletotrichum truncatum]